ncbi:hypothetical protein QR721_07955 [Aciduricibacillus chroicocephali]|uniref:Uncharacterized protein n=1 Tax=Aciduricibacillus chroicocephali TaxID=3054939 RepID=A0ABY9KVA6_9BACI|nr:hypothetical protein QR721_07955 [Bacillaceae bacterium 44XB]
MKRNKERIPIIINEIHYWKKHRLLPAAQCDFLLALYTNGEEAKNQAALQGGNRIVFPLQLLALLVLVPFSFIVIYFTKLSAILQMPILFILLLPALLLYIFMIKREHPLRNLALTVLLMLVLIISVFIGNTYFKGPLTTELVIALNSVGWFIYGRLKRLPYLKVTGVLALLFVIVYTVL